MIKESNKLSPSEEELLVFLIEECGEVISIASKILRFGYGSYNPYDPEKTSNRTLLEGELGDVLAVIKMLEDEYEINLSNIDIEAKVQKKLEFSRNQ